MSFMIIWKKFTLKFFIVIKNIIAPSNLISVVWKGDKSFSRNLDRHHNALREVLFHHLENKQKFPQKINNVINFTIL